MLINSTLHKRTLCTHWTGQNHLGPNITPIERHYRTMYSSCHEKENTLTFQHIGLPVLYPTATKLNAIVRREVLPAVKRETLTFCTLPYTVLYHTTTPIMYKRHHKTFGSSCSEKGKFKSNDLLLIAKLHTYILHVGETSVRCWVLAGVKGDIKVMSFAAILNTHLQWTAAL